MSIGSVALQNCPPLQDHSCTLQAVKGPNPYGAIIVYTYPPPSFVHCGTNLLARLHSRRRWPGPAWTLQTCKCGCRRQGKAGLCPSPRPRPRPASPRHVSARSECVPATMSTEYAAATTTSQEVQEFEPATFSTHTGPAMHPLHHTHGLAWGLHAHCALRRCTHAMVSSSRQHLCLHVAVLASRHGQRVVS